MQKPTIYLFLILTVILTVSLVACNQAGKAVRNNVLLPQLRAVFPAIERQAVYGEVSEEALREFKLSLGVEEGVLSVGDPLIISLHWPPVKNAAIEGIMRKLEEEKIGKGVAESLIERINLFDESIKMLNARSSLP